MKILISNDQPTAMYYIRLSIARALSYCGHETIMWDIRQKSPFDALDEFEPDLLITQGYNITPQLLKCIKERPKLKLIIRVSDWSDFNDNLDKKRYPVLTAGNQEIETVSSITSTHNSVLHIHHHPNYIDLTHGRWMSNGMEVVSLMNCCDVFTYFKSVHKQEYKSDICFVGGRWGYKAQNIDRFIIPLCHPDNNYNIKIFGNQSWGVHQYCGFVPEDRVSHVLKSAVICPSIHEPHSTDFGYDIVTRPFNLLSNGCFCISDYVEGLHDLFPNSIVHCKTPKDFKDKIDHFLSNPNERYTYIEQGKKDILSHTAFDRIALAFERLGINTDHVLDKKEEALRKLNG